MTNLMGDEAAQGAVSRNLATRIPNQTVVRDIGATQENILVQECVVDAADAVLITGEEFEPPGLITNEHAMNGAAIIQRRPGQTSLGIARHRRDRFRRN